MALNPPLVQRIRIALSKISLHNQLVPQASTFPYSLIARQVLVLLLTTPLHTVWRKDMARALDVCPYNLDAAILQLTAEGLVHTDSSDVPSGDVLVLLQPAGALLASHLIDWPTILASILDSLTPATQEELYVHLLHTIWQLQETKRMPTCQMCLTCRHFLPLHYPEDPETPHHCASVDARFGVRDLQIDCPEHSDTDHFPHEA